MIKACCGFGHRVVWADIRSSLDDEVGRAIAEGCHVFYTGAQGDFDRLFTEAVQKVKNKHKDISLICVCPYYTKQIQKNREYYENHFDEVLIPMALDDVHYKVAIPKRNEWMVNHSDLVLGYTVRESSGAYVAIEYAKRQGKLVREIASASAK